jgi:ATP:cob(I)alamin adenosyltransferase
VQHLQQAGFAQQAAQVVAIVGIGKHVLDAAKTGACGAAKALANGTSVKRKLRLALSFRDGPGMHPPSAIIGPYFDQETGMGNRLSKIVTRTGDAGTTGLGDGTRVAKDSLRVETMGQVDELNSTIGLLLTEEMPDDIRQALIGVQHDLFDLGGELCIPGMNMINEAQVNRLEDLVEQFNADLPPLKDFILPGGTRAAAVASSRAYRLPPRRAPSCTWRAAKRFPTLPASTSIACPICCSFWVAR